MRFESKVPENPIPMQRAISLLASLFFAAGSIPAIAQEARTVSFRVLCYQHVNEVKFVSMVPAAGSAGAAVQVPLPTSGFGEDTKGTFTEGMARFIVENSNPPKVVAEGKLAKGDRQVFLFLPSSDTAKMPYRVVALDDDEKSFPMGSTRVLNLAALKVRLNFAGADLPPIPPGSIAVYPKVTTVDEWNMYPARIDFENGKGGWKAVSNQSWKASDTKRDLVITTLDPKTKQPSIRMYQDIPPWRVQALPTAAGNP
jgi:hypothetical protein